MRKLILLNAALRDLDDVFDFTAEPFIRPGTRRATFSTPLSPN